MSELLTGTWNGCPRYCLLIDMELFTFNFNWGFKNTIFLRCVKYLNHTLDVCGTIFIYNDALVTMQCWWHCQQLFPLHFINKCPHWYSIPLIFVSGAGNHSTLKWWRIQLWFCSLLYLHEKYNMHFQWCLLLYTKPLMLYTQSLLLFTQYCIHFRMTISASVQV